MFRALKETTVWTDMSPNHTYLLAGDSVHAYIPKGKTDPVYFIRPLRISVSGRQFVEVDLKKHFPDNAPSWAPNMIRAKGSKGAEYWIDLDEMTCTCKGFQFRGKCSHLELYQ